MTNPGPNTEVVKGVIFRRNTPFMHMFWLWLFYDMYLAKVNKEYYITFYRMLEGLDGGGGSGIL